LRRGVDGELALLLRAFIKLLLAVLAAVGGDVGRRLRGARRRNGDGRDGRRDAMSQGHDWNPSGRALWRGLKKERAPGRPPNRPTLPGATTRFAPYCSKPTSCGRSPRRTG